MIVLEGTDAIGKTSVIKALSEYNLLDRDKNICRLFDFDISLLDRVKRLKEYLTNKKEYVIFLINNDREELERRIGQREVIDEYDKFAYLYNLLYLETYLYMEQKNMLDSKIFMVDCTGLSLDEEIKKVKEKVKSLY